MSNQNNQRRGILLLNTGSPLSTAPREVQRYLGDFLTDERVIQLPTILRTLLVRGIIAPFRAPKSAQKYRLIWSEGRSPLLSYTEDLAQALEQISDLPTFVAMRCNRGSTEQALADAVARGIEELTLLPLFPHYAMSSFESAVAQVVTLAQKHHPELQLTCLAPYALRPEYIQLVAKQVAEYAPPQSRLLLSFHGIPLKQARPYEGNPSKDYQYQCLEMTKQLMADPRLQDLKLSHEVAYQSRFGTTKWLTPATDDRIQALPTEGYDSVAVLCPSFVCDNLETLWEIAIQERERFLQRGGKSLTLIPCLNASEELAQIFAKWILNNEGVTEATEWIAP